MDDAAAAAALLEAQTRLNLASGVLLAVPVPTDLAAEATVVEEATQTAVRESERKGIHGNEVTPFLLKRINELTGGESLRANIALVKNNVKVGAAVANAWAALRRSSPPSAKL